MAVGGYEQCQKRGHFTCLWVSVGLPWSVGAAVASCHSTSWCVDNRKFLLTVLQTGGWEQGLAWLSSGEGPLSCCRLSTSPSVVSSVGREQRGSWRSPDSYEVASPSHEDPTSWPPLIPITSHLILNTSQCCHLGWGRGRVSTYEFVLGGFKHLVHHKPYRMGPLLPCRIHTGWLLG